MKKRRADYEARTLQRPKITFDRVFRGWREEVTTTET